MAEALPAISVWWRMKVTWHVEQQAMSILSALFTIHDTLGQGNSHYFSSSSLHRGMAYHFSFNLSLFGQYCVLQDVSGIA